MTEKLVKLDHKSVAEIRAALLYAHEFDLADKLTETYFHGIDLEEDNHYQVPNGTKSIVFPDGTRKNVRIIKAEGVFWAHYRYLEEFQELAQQMGQIKEIVCPDKWDYE